MASRLDTERVKEEARDMYEASGMEGTIDYRLKQV